MTHRTYKVGDEVLLDTQNLNMNLINKGGVRKFMARFIGPYKVLEITELDTYKIDLPSQLSNHNEFNIRFLKPYVRDENDNRDNPLPRLLIGDEGEGYVIDKIVGARKKDGVQEFRRKFLGDSINNSVWLPESELFQVRDMVKEYLGDRRSTRGSGRV